MCILRDLPTHETLTNNVLVAYESALKELHVSTLKRAFGWYAHANKWVQETAETYGETFDRTLWLTAYFSANADWQTNKKTVQQALETPLPKLYTLEGMYATQRMRREAASLLRGNIHPKQHTLTAPHSRALKVPNFWANIGQPLDPVPVTIDRHAARIATGNDEDSVPSGGAYHRVADAYRDAADTAGILANQIQAVTWVHRVGDMP